MTLADAIGFYRQRLLTFTDTAEANAITALLLEHVLQQDRDQFYKLQRDLLSAAQLEQLSQLSERVLTGEPVQYVLGEAWFCGLKLMVNPRVLIPRPETEELVEWIITNCRFPVSALDILDMGTGSGCIALALKRRIRKARVTAADIDPDALAVARHNAHQLSIDIQLLQADMLDQGDWSHLPSADIIVSNPPYISAAEKTAMSATVLDHEPHLALFAPGPDPLVFYRKLVLLAEQKLKPEGQLFAELNATYAQEIAAMFREANFEVMIKQDMQEKERMLRAWR
jgi:release factor glutamine methyltransferase